MVNLHKISHIRLPMHPFFEEYVKRMSNPIVENFEKTLAFSTKIC